MLLSFVLFSSIVSYNTKMMYTVLFIIITTTTIYPLMTFSMIFGNHIKVVHSFAYYTPTMHYNKKINCHQTSSTLKCQQRIHKYSSTTSTSTSTRTRKSHQQQQLFLLQQQQQHQHQLRQLLPFSKTKSTNCFLNQAVVGNIVDGNDTDNDTTESDTEITAPIPIPIPIPILFDSSNYLHRDVYYHPEQPERITVCVNAIYNKYICSSNNKERPTMNNNNNNIVLIDVATEPLLSIIKKETTNDSKPSHFMTSDIHESGVDDDNNDNNNSRIQYESITPNEYEYARSILLKTHQSELVTLLETKTNLSKQQRRDENKPTLGHMGSIDADTYITTESFNVCIRAAATWIRAINIVSGNYNNEYNNDNNYEKSATIPSFAFALTRPPGHHATYTSSNGFCLYNFAAAAAIHYILSSNNKNAKVSIVDWDVHYGQGISDIIQNYSNIRYVSIHQTPAFPYMGETNTISGQYSNICTIPILPGTTFTNQYKPLFQQALNFICTTSTTENDDDDNDEWIPDIVIVCAGYDALDTDELANVNLQSKDYNTMTQMLCQHLQKTVDVDRTTTSSLSSDSNVIDNKSNSSKRRHRSIPIIFGLEGGYQLNTAANFGNNLQNAVIETIQGLSS